MELELKEDATGVFIPLRVKPKSSKNGIDGIRNGALQLCVRAAPVDGEANAAVIETLAREFGCAKSALQLVRGHKGKDKTVHATGLTASAVLQHLKLSTES